MSKLETNYFWLLTFLAMIVLLFSCHPSPLKVSLPPANRHEPYEYIGQKAMVVAAHPLAVEAGLKILKAGGNAVDAAIATGLCS